ILLSSLKDLTVLSIHPKQRASSTASLYRMRFFPVFFKGYCSHTASAVSKLASSHFRQSFRSTKYLITVSFIFNCVGYLGHYLRGRSATCTTSMAFSIKGRPIEGNGLNVASIAAKRRFICCRRSRI